jgi:hypothetical protein
MAYFRSGPQTVMQSYQYVIGLLTGLQLLGHALSGMVFGTCTGLAPFPIPGSRPNGAFVLVRKE